jgi:hypothetical protein
MSPQARSAEYAARRNLGQNAYWRLSVSLFEGLLVACTLGGTGINT